MCKVKFVKVSQIFEENVVIGMQYKDSWMVVTGFNSVNEAFINFKHLINTVVTDKQSIILCRDDVKRFAKSISNTLRENGIDCVDSKLIFKSLKDFLYSNYIVQRIILNPRTLEYYPANKSFIIHKLI